MLDKESLRLWIKHEKFTVTDEGWKKRLETNSGDVGYCRISDYQEVMEEFNDLELDSH